jgi:2',3'-cyclic-nucleotide 2'-phosphodiesterase/3'-nucleotidase
MTTPAQPQQPQKPTRRTVVTGAAAGVAATAVAAAGPAHAAGNKTGQVTLTVLGTTDLHGNVYNWDYFKNAEFDDSAHNDIGVAKAKTVIDGERAAATGPGARPGRRRHDPGDPARVLLRQGPADRRATWSTRWRGR